MKKGIRRLCLVLVCMVLLGTFAGCSVSVNGFRRTSYTSRQKVLLMDPDDFLFKRDQNAYLDAEQVYLTHRVGGATLSMDVWIPKDVFESIGTEQMMHAPVVMCVSTQDCLTDEDEKNGYVDSVWEGQKARLLQQGIVCIMVHVADSQSTEDLIDLKAAVRSVRFNSDTMPFDVDHIFLYGRRYGGQIAEYCGMSQDDDSYLEDLSDSGAALYTSDGDELSDAVFGVAVYLPNAPQVIAEEGYAWLYGQYLNPDDKDTRQKAQDYMSFVADAGLYDLEGNALTLESVSSGGIGTHGTYYDAVKSAFSVMQSNQQAAGLQTADPISSLSQLPELYPLSAETSEDTFSIKSTPELSGSCAQYWYLIGACDTPEMSSLETINTEGRLLRPDDDKNKPLPTVDRELLFDHSLYDNADFGDTLAAWIYTVMDTAEAADVSRQD